MPRRSFGSTCPPGVMCLTPTLGVLFLVGIVIAVVVLIRLQGTAQSSQEPRSTQIHMPPVIVNGGGGDDRYTRAPEPLRFWQTGPDMRGAMVPPGAVPINVPTRGLPQAFQQVGVIKAGEQLLPLYGRQTAYRTDRYNYYTRTDSYNPIQLPVRFEKRDCMDSNGCSELLGGETIRVNGMNKEGHVEVYKFDGPQYIPGLV
jgi:hypothetical protein